MCLKYSPVLSLIYTSVITTSAQDYGLLGLWSVVYPIQNDMQTLFNCLFTINDHTYKPKHIEIPEMEVWTITTRQGNVCHSKQHPLLH